MIEELELDKNDLSQELDNYRERTQEEAHLKEEEFFYQTEELTKQLEVEKSKRTDLEDQIKDQSKVTILPNSPSLASKFFFV